MPPFGRPPGERRDQRYVNPPPGVPKSQLSAGLLQGLREVPLLFGEMPAAERRIFSSLYNAAIDSEYPDLLQSQHERLEKIVSRGRIANESQFYLVRHAIDVIEGDPKRADELTRLYQLVDAFEARHR